MRCFHPCHYQPENMTVIVGELPKKLALELVETDVPAVLKRCSCPPQSEVVGNSAGWNAKNCIC